MSSTSASPFDSYLLEDLKAVLRSQLTKGAISLHLPPARLHYLRENGYVHFSELGLFKWSLTKKGRSELRVVLTGGVYDLIHVGHLHTLREAASHGNFLVVVVATPQSAKENKERTPIHSIDERLELLNELRVVDLAVPGDPIDKMATVRKIRPDVIALGSDQTLTEARLHSDLEKIGMSHIKIVRLHAEYKGRSTTELIRLIQRMPKI